MEAILISTRERSIPAALYWAINSLALVTVASVSKDKRASTSVETRPGIICKIFNPKDTAKRSKARVTISARLAAAPASFLAWSKV